MSIEEEDVVWLAILVCPECRHEEWASEEDPDAAVSEMWKHLYWKHSGTSKEATGQLMARVKDKPVPPRGRDRR